MGNADDRYGNSMWNVVVLRVAPLLVGLLLGAGGNQFITTQALRDRVLSAAHRQDTLDAGLAAERLAREEQDRATREEMVAMRTDYLKALDRITSRIDAIINQNTEVIQLFKVQQQLKP